MQIHLFIFPLKSVKYSSWFLSPTLLWPHFSRWFFSPKKWRFQDFFRTLKKKNLFIFNKDPTSAFYFFGIYWFLMRWRIEFFVPIKLQTQTQTQNWSQNVVLRAARLRIPLSPLFLCPVLIWIKISDICTPLCQERKKFQGKWFKSEDLEAQEGKETKKCFFILLFLGFSASVIPLVLLFPVLKLVEKIPFSQN